MAKDSAKLSFSLAANDVLTANPGLAFTISQLNAIQSGTLIYRGTLRGGKDGCIDWLRYESDKELTYLSVDGKIYSVTGGLASERVLNLNDFRETLKNAFCCGHRISFCYNTRTDKMSMLNTYPCGCECKK